MLHSKHRLTRAVRVQRSDTHLPPGRLPQAKNQGEGRGRSAGGGITLNVGGREKGQKEVASPLFWYTTPNLDSYSFILLLTELAFLSTANGGSYMVAARQHPAQPPHTNDLYINKSDDTPRQQRTKHHTIVAESSPNRLPEISRVLHSSHSRVATCRDAQ